MSSTLSLVTAAVTLIVLSVPAHADDPKADKGKRLSAEELRTRLRTHLMAENPKLNLGDDFAVKDLTTDGIWDGLGVHVVQVKGSVRTNQTYVIRKDDIFGIGEAVGGSGVNSLCVADFNGDGRPLLVYAYAWGSGDHRSRIAAVDCQAKEPKPLVAPLVNHSFRDFRVRRIDAKNVEVFAAGIRVGRLALETKDEKTTLEVRITEKISAELLEKLKRMPIE
jgi:hypothetical protein